VIRDKFPGRSLSGIGGIESGADAAQFILLGADTVQVCTGVMKMGYDCVKRMKDDLLAFMARHKFETVGQFKGHSLKYFTTHADLVKRQAEAKAAAKAGKAATAPGADRDWQGDAFVKQSDALARG
jgi:dihydropyrimidine dehydrogenase (NADP+)/dihydropyrimidine dehydrogenase (NAD+) subunit PreA